MRRVYLLYHFFHPDDVISARLFSDLAICLTDSKHEVVSFPSVRSCHDGSTKFAKAEKWQGGTIRRVWRPNFRQSSNLGRLLNTLFMLWGWTLAAIFSRRSKDALIGEVLVIGTDPIFGVLAAIPWRLFRPKIKIIHWCHDLHPEATIAEGKILEKSLLVRLLRKLLRLAYRRCDVVVDLGSCMRALVTKAGGWQEASSVRPKSLTITPWSLVEPSEVPDQDQLLRESLYGNCKLALLYSGNLGRAHEVDQFLSLARLCRHDGIHFCFAGRGLGIDALKLRLTDEDRNIAFAGFAEESVLQKRLSACDIHMVSLKDAWTGTVVPSKFFGAIAIGRPVLFSGSEDSCIAGWINEYGIGWHLTHQNTERVRESLIQYAASLQSKEKMQSRCIDIYRRHFSKASQMSKWIELVSNCSVKG